jgi:hypothetical protein
MVFGEQSTEIQRPGFDTIIPHMRLNETAWVKLGPEWHFNKLEASEDDLSDGLDPTDRCLWSKVSIFEFQDHTDGKALANY